MMSTMAQVTLCECFARDGLQHEPAFVPTATKRALIERFVADEMPDTEEEAMNRFLTDEIEQALGTPVQTAVKREDEQAFAELNAANPIFVEDAVRAFAQQLLADPRFGDFRVVASHQESLHSHDAVSLMTSGPTFAQASLDPMTFAGLRA